MRKLLALALVSVAPFAIAQERAIHKEVVVNAPVAAAWSAWATSEGIQSFFAPEAIVEARPGGAFSIHINPYAKPGMKGADDMKVLGVQENRMISFTWTLTHLGWGDGGEWDKAYQYFDGAWTRVMAQLEKRFAEGKPYDWTEWRARMKAHEASQPK